MPDATLSATYGGFGNYTRSTLSFQITPRLSGSFRYSELKAFPFAVSEDYFDRSFDIRYLLMKESGWRPAIVVGMSDIIGTGVYSGEYVVATKTLMPGLKVTGGIGWGRFGSEATLGSLGTRPTTVLGQGGKFTTDRWFRGDMAAFGGVSYAPNDRFKFKVEYSSDQYEREVASGGVEHKSPWNFGVDYKLWQGAGQLSLYSVLGSEVGAQLTVYTNPKTLGVPGGVEPSGLPVAPRPAGAAADLGWTVDPQKTTAAQTQLAQTLASEGIRLEGMTLESRRAVVRVSNPRFNSEAQALGRIARVMTRTLPASVEQFEIIPMVNGMATSSVVIMRSDLEREEHEAAIEILPRVRFYDGFGREPEAYQSSYPQFDWSLAPYLDVSVFDPEEPVRTEGGLRGTFSLDVTPNLVFSGSASYRATGNISDISRRDESGLPRVRTDAPVYAAEGDETIENLQLAYYGRPGKNLYGRISAGYLEEMYGGVSAEILWKPVTSRVAFGAEVNWIQRRDYDQLFGFQSMTTTDPVSGVK
ncbi:MAG: YjbH domain-containing protein, partial [Sagittula sp.]